jgi:response regulator of citrate/malate metabolism
MEEKFSLKATEAGIPDIVIKKFKFQNAQTDLTDFYLYERILNYKHFNTDEEKLSAIFCVDLKNIYKAGSELPQIIMSFNGELDEYFVKQGLR